MIIFLDKQHDIKVFIPHIEFSKFNSATSESYFGKKKLNGRHPSFILNNQMAKKSEMVVVKYNVLKIS